MHSVRGFAVDETDELVIEARHLARALNAALDGLAERGVDCRSVEDLHFDQMGRLRTNVRVSLALQFTAAR